MAESIRAVFLDRDGTVARGSPTKLDARDMAIARLLGATSFTLTTAIQREAFEEAGRAPRPSHIATSDAERDFWNAWYASILRRLGYQGDRQAAAGRLSRDYPPWKLLQPYPDALHAMRRIKRSGLPIGIISDTFPSLEASFVEMGLAEYVDSYTSSALVGVGKPDPRIYQHALESLRVLSAASIFVDDTLGEVEGARAIGMRALHIDRRAPEDDLARGVITTLAPLLTVLGLEPQPVDGTV
jgi:putative hydrolase of the HAD superfamily